MYTAGFDSMSIDEEGGVGGGSSYRKIQVFVNTYCRKSCHVTENNYLY